MSGIPVDARVCMYAYKQSDNITWNVVGGTATAKTYAHHVTSIYSLQDVNKVYLATKSIIHVVPTTVPTVMDTVEQGLALISANIPTWALADKLALSGYVPPTT